mmetsp:Transcript_41393/g.107224  ORF Transcript_41393/g.107224 Transcript_41393/m.107224 type:complete len:228 (-) Transcript_41393:190-873(-)
MICTMKERLFSSNGVCTIHTRLQRGQIRRQVGYFHVGNFGFFVHPANGKVVEKARRLLPLCRFLFVHWPSLAYESLLAGSSEVCLIDWVHVAKVSFRVDMIVDKIAHSEGEAQTACPPRSDSLMVFGAPAVHLRKPAFYSEHVPNVVKEACSNKLLFAFSPVYECHARNKTKARLRAFALLHRPVYSTYLHSSLSAVLPSSIPCSLAQPELAANCSASLSAPLVKAR